jgi:hypothetical protein
LYKYDLSTFMSMVRGRLSRLLYPQVSQSKPQADGIIIQTTVSSPYLKFGGNRL